ncbi:MAG: hypothetical protein J6S85_04515 [Methanobrevibacter sp.]|nr:hypothetical protein [Methanobrevibacter sp.]MBO7712809.1 hypothetical protein [Methanobrevibacter sp.]
MKKENKLIQHLKTYKKYNTLENKYETLREELDRKGTQVRILEKSKEVAQKLYEEELEKKEQKIIELTKERAKLKKEIKELRKNEK